MLYTYIIAINFVVSVNMMKFLLVLLPILFLIGINFTRIESTSNKNCDIFTESSELSLTSNDDEFNIQALLLAGFNYNDRNHYNILKGGFMSNSHEKQCIPVNYTVEWNCTSNEACYNNTLSMCLQSGEFSYLWTVFDPTTRTGNVLIDLVVYDLRVFGFELCDIYKEPVEIKITLIEEFFVPINCFSLCTALANFTTMVSYKI